MPAHVQSFLHPDSNTFSYVVHDPATRNAALIDAALDYNRAERDTDDYDVRLKTQARHGLWRHNGQAEYNRELRDDVLLGHHRARRSGMLDLPTRTSPHGRN